MKLAKPGRAPRGDTCVPRMLSCVCVPTYLFLEFLLSYHLPRYLPAYLLCLHGAEGVSLSRRGASAPMLQRLSERLNQRPGQSCLASQTSSPIFTLKDLGACLRFEKFTHRILPPYSGNKRRHLGCRTVEGRWEVGVRRGLPSTAVLHNIACVLTDLVTPEARQFVVSVRSPACVVPRSLFIHAFV